MATSGNTVVTVTSYDNLKFSWWRDSYSIAGNYTDIGWKLELIASNYGAISSSASKSWSVNVNGTAYSGTNTIGIGNNQTKTLASGTTRINHNADGTKSFNYSFSQQFDINFNGWIGTKSGSGSGTLDTIPRYTTITAFTVAKRNETSVTYNFTTADTCDYVWYSKDNGSTWTGVNITDGTSGSFNVTGLSANTTYKFKLRVRRKDSQLTTDSSTVQQTTYKVPTQSLNNKTETRIVMNWSIDSTADHIWYSTNNGSSWVDAGSVNATSGTVTINNLSPNTAYNVRLRIRRTASQTTYDIGATNITTYKAPTQSLNSKTETTIKMNWSCDSTVSKVEYSKDNGSTWTTVTNDANATSGNYTISNLTANTTYNIKTRLTRKATNTNYSTGTTAIATYDYPHITTTPNFTIGNAVSLTLYNPLGRNCTVIMYGDDWSTIYSGDGWTGTSVGNFATQGIINNLYASIPNKQKGTYHIKVRYNGVDKDKTNAGTYSVKGDETPTFSNYTYKDSNAVVTGVTGNDQIMVKGLSTVQVTISSSNKMTAKNSATGKNYSMSMSSLSASVNYSTSDIVKELGTINASGTQRLSVTAYDSRGLGKTVNKDITVYDYSKPVINATVKRLNDFENQTTIQVSGTYTKLAINNVNKNSITSVQYRYRETGGTWSSWTTLNTTVNNGSFSCTSVTRDLDNTKSYEIQIRATDTLQQTTTNTYKVDVGQAIFFVSSNNKKCYINGQEIIMYDIVDEW